MTMKLELSKQVHLLSSTIFGRINFTKQKVKTLIWRYRNINKIPWRLHFFMCENCEEVLADEMSEDLVIILYCKIINMKIFEEDACNAAYRYMSRTFRIVNMQNDEIRAAYFKKYKHSMHSDALVMQKYFGFHFA